MTKSHLLGIYRTKLNHIKLAYACLVLWNDPVMPQYFEMLRRKWRDIPQLFPDISNLVHDSVSMKIACEELYDSAHRSAIKELFTFTKRYCSLTGQLDLLKTQPWYQFWRIIRNCWAHDMIFCFSNEEKKMLPVTWSGITIHLRMDGKNLTHGICSREKLRELLEEATTFISLQLA